MTDDTSFENLKRAIIYGSAMASFCVEEFSIGKLRTLNEEMINERLQQFIELASFDLKMADSLVS